MAKRGFFSLRDCGEMAVKNCALCGRPMCSAHLSPRSGFVNCLDCDARQSEQTALGQPTDDPNWTYRYRDRYYSSAGYAPIYAGTHYDSYYDRYDTRSFDSSMASTGPAAAAAGDWDDAGKGSVES
jgi:hypothetical protein